MRPENLLKKETLAKVFSCNICKISKNTFCYITSPVDASKNTVYIASISTSQWKRLNWKAPYSVALASNTKWVFIQLFGCGRAKLVPLGEGHLHHLMFINELLLIWPVSHMGHIEQIWSLNLSKCPELGN